MSDGILYCRASFSFKSIKFSYKSLVNSYKVHIFAMNNKNKVLWMKD